MLVEVAVEASSNECVDNQDLIRDDASSSDARCSLEQSEPIDYSLQKANEFIESSGLQSTPAPIKQELIPATVMSYQQCDAMYAEGLQTWVDRGYSLYHCDNPICFSGSESISVFLTKKALQEHKKQHELQ